MIPRLLLFGLLVACYAAAIAKASATTDAGCTNPNVAPQAVRAASLVYPPSAAALHLGARVAIVEVVIDSSGALLETNIVRSTENAAMDQAALDAARASAFSPATVNCVPVKRAAVVRYVFNPASNPTFEPPAGWTAQLNAAPDTPLVGIGNGAFFGGWKREHNVLFLFERAGTETVDASKLAGADATVAESTSVRTCNGTQDANFVAIRRGQTDPMPGYWALLLASTQSDEYVVSYYSREGTPPDIDVKNSMLSLCAPSQ
jgi:TonB family protein